MKGTIQAAFAVAAVSLGGCATREPAAAAPPQRIAIVRLDACFNANRCDKARAFEKNIQDRKKDIADETKQLEKTFMERGDVVSLCPEGSKAKLEAVRKFEMAKAELGFQKASSAIDLARELARGRAETLQEILRVAHLVAAEQGFDLVLPLRESLDDGVETPDEVSKSVTAVLSARPELDITDNVIERMNREYKRP